MSSQESVLLCPSGFLDNHEVYQAFCHNPRAAAQRVNRMVTEKLFAGQLPLSNLSCMALAVSADILPYHGMRVVITENHEQPGCHPDPVS